MKKICLFLLCVSCAPRIETHGFENLKMESEAIHSNKETKTSVLEKLGVPNATSIDKKNWYYVYIKKEFLAFLKGVIKENILLKLTFDEKGVLIKKELIDGFLKKQNMLQDITPIERSKKKDNYIAEILGNIANTHQERESSKE